MLKKYVIKRLCGLAVAAVTLLALAGCAKEYHQQTAEYTTLGGNQWVGVPSQPLTGGVTGARIAHYMAPADFMQLSHALSKTSVGDSASWTNTQFNISFVITPIKNYKQDGYTCRRYQSTVSRYGKPHRGYGNACWRNGRWVIENW